MQKRALQGRICGSSGPKEKASGVTCDEISMNRYRFMNSDEQNGDVIEVTYDGLK
jgi:hypothetical protein